MLAWIEANQTMILWAAGFSVALFLATLIAAPIAIVRIPANYFESDQRRRAEDGLALRIARNILGWLLIAAGLVMLVIPGPGVLVAVLGVALADFPGKYKAQRWLITRGSVLKRANTLRARYAKPPLKVDGAL